MYCSKRCGLNLAQKRYRQRKTEEGHESPATPGRRRRSGAVMPHL
jgi:hypothetical protein